MWLNGYAGHPLISSQRLARRWVRTARTRRWLSADWVPGQHSFSARGSVTFQNNKDTARLSGWWCENNGPAATYTWSVSGGTLTLTPVGGHDGCGIRGFIWAGTWTRSSSR